MTMTTWQILATIGICTAVTVFTRAVSFLVFPGGKKAPAFILWMGSQLPRAVMAMLVVYCLKDISFAQTSGWIPALMGVAVTAALHVWKRQMFLSIGGGTLVYMVLLRVLGAA